MPIPCIAVPPAERSALLWRRFHGQRLSDAGRVEPDPAAAARAVCAVQAQELNAGCLSLRVRTTGLTRDAVMRALQQERSLTWTWLLRGTLHICAADDLRWLLSLLGPLNAARAATRRAQVGLDDDTCARGVRVIRDAVAGGPLTRHQLRERLLSRNVDVTRDPQAMIHLIGYAANRGVIVIVPSGGRDNRFTLFDDWVPRAAVPSREVAEAELARRYFSAFGPATVADFRAWAGVPARMARHATELIGAELEEPAGREPGLLAMRASETPRIGRHATVRLLPRWDTYLLGYRSRDHMLEPEHAGRVIGGGWFRPTICIDGHIDGAWELRRSGKAWLLEAAAFEQFTADVRRGIRSEGDAISDFLGAPVQVTGLE